jgi:NAD/NADP transhydrogenase beta subunit
VVGNLGSSFGDLTGRQVETLSAHQALKVINVLLLVLAAIAFVVALMRLANPAQSDEGRGGLASVGVTAALLIIFRMVDRPAAPQDVFAVSLSWGIWLALLSAIAIVAGDLWPRRASAKNGPTSIRSWWAGY